VERIMFEVMEQNDLVTIDNLGILDSDGETFIDPDLAEDLTAEFQEFGVTEGDVEEAAEKANITAEKVSFYFINNTDNHFDKIREVLVEEYGEPEDSHAY